MNKGPKTPNSQNPPLFSPKDTTFKENRTRSQNILPNTPSHNLPQRKRSLRNLSTTRRENNTSDESSEKESYSSESLEVEENKCDNALDQSNILDSSGYEDSSSFSSYEDYADDNNTDSNEERSEDSQESEIDDNLVWNEIDKFTKPNFPRFSPNFGVKRDLTNLIDPKDFFHLIISEEMIKNICLWTNNHAENKRDRRRRESHERKWEHLTFEKLKAFIGFLILLPMVQKPRLRDYWCENILTGTPGLRQIFTRDEFFQIKQYLRFYDDQSFDANDPFYRFRQLFDEILTNSNELYKPPKSLTLDESMIKFDGASRFKVYMPLKPIKFGFKVYSVVPSEVPFVLNMQIHDAKRRSWLI